MIEIRRSCLLVPNPQASELQLCRTMVCLFVFTKISHDTLACNTTSRKCKPDINITFFQVYLMDQQLDLLLMKNKRKKHYIYELKDEQRLDPQSKFSIINLEVSLELVLATVIPVLFRRIFSVERLSHVNNVDMVYLFS